MAAGSKDRHKKVLSCGQEHQVGVQGWHCMACAAMPWEHGRVSTYRKGCACRDCKAANLDRIGRPRRASRPVDDDWDGSWDDVAHLRVGAGVRRPARGLSLALA